MYVLASTSQEKFIPIHHHHHHLFAQYAEMNSKICNVLDRKANSFSSNNCPEVQNYNYKNTTLKTHTSQLK